MYDYSVWFCNDGVLRVTYNNSKEKVLIDIQDVISSYKNEFSFWFDLKNSNCFFEENVTLGNILNAIEPYKDFWASWLRKDLDSYLKELKKPIDAKEAQIFDFLEISWHNYISPDIEYVKDENNNRNLFDFSKKRDYILSNKIENERYINILGFKDIENSPEGFSLSFLKINQISNTPILLKETEQIILGGDYYLEEKEKPPFINKESEIINKYKFHNYEYNWLEKDASYNIYDVLEGIFSSFPYSCEVRDNQEKDLKEALKYLDNKEKSSKKDSNEDADIKNINNLTNEDNNNNLDVDDTANKKVTKVTKVTFAPGAFDSVISHLEREQQYWKDLLKKPKNGVLKINPKKATNNIKHISGKLIK